MNADEQINADLRQQLGALVIDQIAARVQIRTLEAEIAALRQQLTERQDNGG